MAERWVASLIGLAGVGAGGVGVFLSDNQAGTTAILLLGAVFLLMGVQGTAIIKAGKDSVEMERRRAGQKMLEQAADLIEEQEPREAAELVKAAKSVDPSLNRDATVRQLSHDIYLLELHEALNNVLPRLRDGGAFRENMYIIERGSRRPNTADIVIKAAGDPGWEIDIVARQTMRASYPLAKVRSLINNLKVPSVPLLFVSNRPLDFPQAADTLWQDSDDVLFLEWRESDDDNELEEALHKLLGATVSGD